MHILTASYDGETSHGVSAATTSLTVIPTTQPPSAPTGPPAPPIGPSSTATLPTLMAHDAKHHVTQELGSRFRAVFRHRHHYTTSCSRDSRTQMRCKVFWQSGKYDYSGTLVIFYVARKQAVHWDSRLRIKRVARTCVAHHARRCVRHYSRATGSVLSLASDRSSEQTVFAHQQRRVGART